MTRNVGNLALSGLLVVALLPAAVLAQVTDPQLPTEETGRPESAPDSVAPPTEAGASPQLVDRVVAVVDEECILLSDLEREIESYRFEAQTNGVEIPDNPVEVRQKMLDRLVEVKFLVAQAKVDGIEISEDELENAVAQDLQSLIDRFGTRSALEQELQRLGMTFNDLEARHRELNRNRFYTSRMINIHIRPKVEVLDTEVRTFYDENQDQFPSKPASLRLANILIVPQLSTDAQDRLQEGMTAIQQQLDAGISFDETARQFSQGPNAGRGGLIGSFARGDLFSTALDDAAWKLNVGEVSDWVQTEIGLHLLRLESKTDTEVELRQIMLRLEVGESDRAAALERARKVWELAAAGQDFAELARVHSDDPSTRDRGGDLGEFTFDRLNPQFIEAVQNLDEGQVSEPIEASSGYFILKVTEKAEGEALSFEEVEPRLRQIITERKIEAELKGFIAGLRDRFYMNIKA